MLIDSDLMVSVLRSFPPAVEAVDALPDRWISIITYMELIQGGRSKEQIRGIKQYLDDYNFDIYPLTENIGHLAAVYVETYCPAHGLRFGDALIAATAMENGQTLFTANRKHYQFITGLDIKAFKPLKGK